MRFFIFTFICEFPQEKRQLKLIIIKEDAYVVLRNWEKTFHNGMQSKTFHVSKCKNIVPSYDKIKWNWWFIYNNHQGI